MRSLKTGAIKGRPLPNPKVYELMKKLTSLIDSKTDDKHLENGNIGSITADIFDTEFTVDEAKLLQSHLNLILSIHADDVNLQTIAFDDHTTAYLKSINLTELSDDDKEFIRRIKMMRMKGLEIEQKKLDYWQIAIRLLAYTNETANPQFRIDRIMSRVINKVVVLSDEDGFDRIKYVQDFRDAESKELIAKNASIKRNDSDDEEEMEPVPDDKTQRRKLTAKKTLRKETFMENMFRSMTGRF
jgi:hypothetical protein